VAGLALFAVAVAALLTITVRSTLDLVAPVSFTGEVLRRTEVRSTARDRWWNRRAPVYIMIIDDGRKRKLRPWLARREYGDRVGPGHVVHARGQRWSRRLTSITYAVTD
jgi:hypothetical protein